ncbi:MAG: hydrogenase nickel incorporation protein HypB [Deltaproteobacteria bacterium]|nr:hydrogenase nickel incorporation protein HypB [Deltaproteobacteria bacterium]
MCDVCGCGDPARVKVATTRAAIDVNAPLLSDNDRRAHALRARFSVQGVTALDVMGSPGSGKTALIEATARALGPGVRLAAVSGDLATALDAERLARAGVASAPITTGSACHLDARMIEGALAQGSLAESVASADVFFIENVGNLVCPAIYDLGQHRNVVLLSVTEGVDKPLKYPVMFERADVVVLTKIDLLPHLPEVSIEAIGDALARVMPRPRLIPLSARTGDGLETWIAWLEAERAAVRSKKRGLLAPAPLGALGARQR